MPNVIWFDEGQNHVLENDVVGPTVYFLLSTLKLKQTYLTADVTLPASTIQVQSTDGFEASGTLSVDGQTVTYGGKTQTAFTGCSGGTGAKTAGKGVTQTGGVTAASTLGGGVGEITGWTGASAYARKTEAGPAPSSGLMTFADKVWVTGAATDGPAAVRSVIAVTSADNSGKALAGWHLQDDGASLDMSVASATLTVQAPKLWLANVSEAG